MTIEYSFDRFSFGRPLASYQALKHRFADLKLWTEASLATAGAAADAVDGRSEKAYELVSVAKSYIGDHAPAILSGLRPAPWWHRGHLGPRPPPLSSAGSWRTAHCSERPRNIESGSLSLMGLEESDGH